jgi:hypothetical protein
MKCRFTTTEVQEAFHAEVGERLYIVRHSRHFISRAGAAPNNTTSQNSSDNAMAAQRQRYEQTSAADTVRVLRFTEEL